MKTKEQAVREEVKFGAEQGMLPELIQALRRPGMNIDRLTAIANGAPMEDDEVNVLFSILLNGDEDMLEDDEDE